MINLAIGTLQKKYVFKLINSNDDRIVQILEERANLFNCIRLAVLYAFHNSLPLDVKTMVSSIIHFIINATKPNKKSYLVHKLVVKVGHFKIFEACPCIDSLV